ncbi:23S rRNA (guanine(745)-N(1))-methyltransferase [Shewanella corallii]|uniref:23S rRNA (Guanine(745)-N(1))-methyltransferase n=1 Tax=Shewanella corallii TaxID=560080 RepID=A0ABT0NA80_9GAMM|nr:23S rRNA (guanine(745)-N(1))-methyltransferase [Shewanella corallii]MCL2914752.1 23S rRNA (guanine(745)-N(1))-methyltransferase [Shewanella corallii]
MNYICPLCRSQLFDADRSLACASGHRFDFAKEGYINLLPVNKKKSKDPGDNKEMMLARRSFLDAGHYEFLSQRVGELAKEFAKDSTQVLDLGCGEGYYTQRLQQALSSDGNELSVYGLDISRAALRYAAKRYRDIRFSVASSYDMPFADASFDLMLRIYAPSKAAEMARVLKPGATLITVSPGKTHHYALKQMIYDEPRFHEVKDTALEGFETVHQENLTSVLCLPPGDMVLHFLEMTPYAWKFASTEKQQLAKTGLECELDFFVEVHRKNHDLDAS